MEPTLRPPQGLPAAGAVAAAHVQASSPFLPQPARKHIARSPSGQVPISPPTISVDGVLSGLNVTSMLQPAKPEAVPNMQASSSITDTSGPSPAEEQARRSVSLTMQAAQTNSTFSGKDAAVQAPATAGGQGAGPASKPSPGQPTPDRTPERAVKRGFRSFAFGSLITRTPSNTNSPPTMPKHAPSSAALQAPGASAAALKPAADTTQAGPTFAPSPQPATLTLAASDSPFKAPSGQPLVGAQEPPHEQGRQQPQSQQLEKQPALGLGLEEEAPKPEPSPTRDSAPDLAAAAAAPFSPATGNGGTPGAQAQEYNAAQPRSEDKEAHSCCPIWPM